MPSSKYLVLAAVIFAAEVAKCQADSKLRSPSLTHHADDLQGNHTSVQHSSKGANTPAMTPLPLPVEWLEKLYGWPGRMMKEGRAYYVGARPQWCPWWFYVTLSVLIAIIPVLCCCLPAMMIAIAPCVSPVIQGVFFILREHRHLGPVVSAMRCIPSSPQPNANPSANAANPSSKYEQLHAYEQLAVELDLGPIGESNESSPLDRMDIASKLYRDCEKLEQELVESHVVDDMPKADLMQKIKRLAAAVPAIKAEALLVVVGPLLGYLLGIAAAVVTRVPRKRFKVPSFAVLVLLVFVLRGKYADVALVRATNLWEGDATIGACGLLLQDVKGCPPSLKFTLSSLEILDSPSDGLAMASATLAGPEVHHRFVDSWRNGSLAFMVPLVDRLGIAGLMGANQLIASTVQAGVALRSVSAAADIGGLGALAKRITEMVDPVQQAGLVSALVCARVLFESAPQMMWQTSLLMAREQSILSQPVLAISISLSYLSMTKKVVELMAAGVRKFSLERTTPHGFVYTFVNLVVTSAPLLLFLWYMAVRLYMMEVVCPSRVWGISTGCVIF